MLTAVQTLGRDFGERRSRRQPEPHGHDGRAPKDKENIVLPPSYPSRLPALQDILQA
jgi:hypothetical protein